MRLPDLLEEIGRRAAFEGGNPYKAKAYVRAAASLRRLPRPLDGFARGETDEALERMRRKMPAGLLEMLVIPGVKPQTILKLHTLFAVNSLEELIAACSRGEIAATKGLGAALERKILQGIAIACEGAGRRLRMNQAQAVLDETIAELKRLRPELRKITIAGEMRRACELVPTCAL